MTMDYFRSFSFPEEGAQYFLSLEQRMNSNPQICSQVREIARQVGESRFDLSHLEETVEPFCAPLDAANESLRMMVLLLAGETLHQRYREQGLGDELFFANMRDTASKALECKDCRGVWGTFVEWWFDGMFALRRFALGRFQYEADTLREIIRLSTGEVIPVGAPAVQVHIPSAQGSMRDESRIDSYRRAWKFFNERDYLFRGKLVMTCESWLLYGAHRDFLPKTSNILRFMDDFTLTESMEDTVGFANGWRIFGGSWGDDRSPVPADVNALRDDTSLLRAYKSRLQQGGKCGEGVGYMVFDGEKIIR